MGFKVLVGIDKSTRHCVPQHDLRAGAGQGSKVGFSHLAGNNKSTQHSAHQHDLRGRACQGSMVEFRVMAGINKSTWHSVRQHDLKGGQVRVQWWDSGSKQASIKVLSTACPNTT